MGMCRLITDLIGNDTQRSQADPIKNNKFILQFYGRFCREEQSSCCHCCCCWVGHTIKEQCGCSCSCLVGVHVPLSWVFLLCCGLLFVKGEEHKHWVSLPPSSPATHCSLGGDFVPLAYFLEKAEGIRGREDGRTKPPRVETLKTFLTLPTPTQRERKGVGGRDSSSDKK